ncbi:DUF72 domain-containing protein [Hyphomicrobium sp.]|uniref:DUF72 domain-containing protein n=1 Tax=Hyphomicrobium sp. TaxID=82 RepID=UPI002D76D2A7|nr:DUF72 domain-containing protein [Hyphomicrobium sp.]HET6390370.1 DUF72 domain-containing protein [Hyphomicrobium sp.]
MRKAQSGKLFIGTSGWSYDDWRLRFYPEGVPRSRWLPWYAERFGSAEVNGSFYRTPSLEAVESWRNQTPADFLFAWKASKFITHWKRLGPSSANSLELMETRLSLLGRKCGPVLFQLPARFRADCARLSDFLAMLSPKRRYAFEFRDASWYDDNVYALLAKHDVSLCLSDHHDAPSPWVSTASHVYVRGHGPTGRYKGSYPTRTLGLWADEIQSWRSAKKTVYVYFDNDQKSAAPKDAARLLDLCAEPHGHTAARRD